MKYKKIDKFTSCGGILFFKDKIVLLFHHKRKELVFPQGHQKGGETLKETALREIKEETGFQSLRYIRKLGQHQYNFVQDDVKYYKTIHIYLFELLDKKHKKNTQEPNEHFSNRFFSYQEAMNKLKWEADKKLLKKAKKYIDNII